MALAEGQGSDMLAVQAPLQAPLQAPVQVPEGAPSALVGGTSVCVGQQPCVPDGTFFAASPPHLQFACLLCALGAPVIAVLLTQGKHWVLSAALVSSSFPIASLNGCWHNGRWFGSTVASSGTGVAAGAIPASQP